MLGQHGIKSAPPPSLPASPGVWSCSPMLSTIAARAAGPARPLWNRVAFMTLVLPRFGSSGRAGAVQSRCRRRVRAVRWCSPPHQRRSWRYQERCRWWWYRSRNAAALPHHRYWRSRRWWSMQPKGCGPPVSMFLPMVSVVQLVQYGAGPPNDACERADGSQSALLGVHASVSCCW